MGAQSTERATRINELDLKHQRNVHQMDLTNRDEEARLLKLRMLTLRDENSSLKDRLIQRDALVKQLTKQGNEAHVELRETKEKLKSQDVRLRKQDNELEALKTEINSLNDFRQDSNKVLQEKLALSHKLDQIQPELNHLKAQLETHRAVVAQKQDLERQLSSLEVELQNEKRSKQRMQSKSHDNDHWKDQFEEAKKELEKIKKEHNRELREAHGECDRLEGRVEDTRSKLKKTQTELKDARAELEASRAELEEARKAALSTKTTKKTVTVKDQPGRKRRAHEISLEDISIGTPGPDEATLKRSFKKRGAELALVGEKSTFSITPFLNRTKNLDMEDELSEIQSPTGKAADVMEPLQEHEEDDNEAGEPVPTEPAEDPAESPGHDNDVAIDAEVAPVPKARESPRQAQEGPGRCTDNKKEHAVEEAEAGEQENKPTQKAKKGAELKTVAVDNLPKPGNLTGVDADGRKKKRKILGGANNKTLFDDDDGETVPRPAKIQLAPGRRLKAPLGGVSKAFGGATFSPLKRDRRGVGATVSSIRWSSSASRWKQRQGRDAYARGAKVQGLKSRAAFKLLEMDSKYRLFRGNGQTVVDLGYAPGSWSQVAVERTRPNGRVIGIDLIPAQPPRGVATFQGDFLSPSVQEMVKSFILEAHRRPPPLREENEANLSEEDNNPDVNRPSYIDMERHAGPGSSSSHTPEPEESKERLVDVVLSDMSAPWEQTSGFNVNSLSNPYHRLMNTSGNAFRDHTGSMDLCAAALHFASDTLKSGGHFVCKFYQGPEDKAFEKQLKTLFAKVFREKPESSRKESREAYFVGLRRKPGVIIEPPSHVTG
ncbi:hypothetical protein NM208_g11910 [Fusarium decemcellulare]|uniref:Uncharacterized protein n=1 Tax=Fusarium decemcellulare TaxID=57161 RepID=A0ACC1RU09_9HYPO|nr:hypothetical protein NM208_g11910 [Fusarium decemcellulare]